MMTAFQVEQRKGQQATVTTAEINKKRGEVFLAANKTKEGVVTLSSGLQYKILKTGNGRKPTNADSVECHYRSTLIDGTEFDSSLWPRATSDLRGQTGHPWDEGSFAAHARVGSNWQLFIPPELAYGTHGSGGQIGPNATLIFEMELLAIK